VPAGKCQRSLSRSLGTETRILEQSDRWLSEAAFGGYRDLQALDRRFCLSSANR
jgi:hypothetical protein